MARWLHEIKAESDQKRHEEAMGYADDLSEQLRMLRAEISEATNWLQKAVLEKESK
jgi:hypothetical protein